MHALDNVSSHWAPMTASQQAQHNALSQEIRQAWRKYVLYNERLSLAYGYDHVEQKHSPAGCRRHLSSLYTVVHNLCNGDVNTLALLANFGA